MFGSDLPLKEWRDRGECRVLRRGEALTCALDLTPYPGELLGRQSA